MAVYLIINVDVKDPSTYEQYKAKVPALTRKHGGEYLVQGGNFQILEGTWQPNRLVLSRFPDKESVEAFFNDLEYQPLKELRHRVASTDIVMVEGV
jgi:uncharacterized protein (DUF1330 family)